MNFPESRESKRTPDGHAIPPSAPHQGIFCLNFNPHEPSQLVLKKTSNAADLSPPAIKTISSLSLLLEHLLLCPA